MCSRADLFRLALSVGDRLESLDLPTFDVTGIESQR